MILLPSLSQLPKVGMKIYAVCAVAALSGLPVAVSTAPSGDQPAAQVKATPTAYDSAVQELVLANHILAQKGIVDAYGHVSIRDPRNPNRYLLSRSVAPAMVTTEDILEYDLSSEPVAGDGRPGVLERFIHGEIYKSRPDVRAIVHSHSAAVIPFSVTKVPLRPVFHMAAFLHMGVPVWDPRSSSDAAAAGMLVRNRILGASLAKALGDKPAALLRGHGAVIVAPNIKTAVRNAIYLDMNARLQAEAIHLGGPITYVSPEEGATMAGSKGDLDRAWELWSREVRIGR